MSKIAFIFPGQGSQSKGMLADLGQEFPIIQEYFNRASQQVGYDVWQLTQEGPEERLNQTECTQVAMLTADVAVFELLKTLKNFVPALMAGHSLGEYAALVCSEAIRFEDAVKLVSVRGQLMQKHIPFGVGGMAAIVGLTDEQVESICWNVSDSENQVTPANFNAIGQVVIAGHLKAVQQAIGLAEANNALLARLIPVSVPCHCSLLKDAAAEFENYLAKTDFKTPKFSVISNVNVNIYESPEQIRELLKEQLYRPVRWVETIQAIQSNDCAEVIECGPGKVLSGLVKRIEKSLPVRSVYNKQTLMDFLSDKQIGNI